MRIIIGRRLRRDKRGVSNILVVVLSLVIIVTIVANVILWSYEMNQMDWEKIKEGFKITDVVCVTRSPWYTAESEFTVNEGSLLSGSYTDTQAVESQYERFTEALASSTYCPIEYSVSEGVYLSGTVPSSVQTVDTDYFVVSSSGTASSTEFTFSNMATYTPTQLNFTIVSEYDVTNVSVTIQIWNFSSSAYVTSGEGYLTYMSSGSNETKLLNIHTNPHFSTSTGNAKIKVTSAKSTISGYQQKVNQVKLDYKVENRLDINGVFIIDLSTYPVASIQTIEIQLRYRANDTGEIWYLRAYNWITNAYSDSGFNKTAGHTPTTGWDYYAVNLTDKFDSYVSDTGTIHLKLQDNQADNNQTTVDIDFLGARAKVDRARFTFKNECSLSVHLVSLWIINATLHQHYNADVVLNSAETYNYIQADISLPSGTFTVKVVSERGNTAVYSSGS